MFRLLAYRYIPRTKRSRWIISVAALLAVSCLVLSQLSPARVAGTHRAPGVQVAGSNGSLHHRPWWDPGGWFAGGGGAPKPRVLADDVAAVPGTGRTPRQAAMGPVHRVRELTNKRDEYTRVFTLSDGRLQAVVSTVPANYRDSAGRWQPINTAVSRATGPGYVYGNESNTFGSFFGATPRRLVGFVAPGGGWLTISLTGGKVGRPRVSGDTV